MRLIDAVELTGQMMEAIKAGYTAEDMLDIVNEEPTIDAEPVVRCKDCKYMIGHYDTDGNAPYWVCTEWDSGTDYDGYCHLGEKVVRCRDCKWFCEDDCVRHRRRIWRNGWYCADGERAVER